MPMPDYKTIAESKNFIVLDKYTAEWKAAEGYQTEEALERELIQDLVNQGYEFVPGLNTPEKLLANVRVQLQALNNVQFTDAEWQRFVSSWLDKSSEGIYAQSLAGDIRTAMQQHAGVFRTQASMDEGVKKIAELRDRVASVTLQDKSKVFNTARIEALEVDNLIEVAQATMVSAAARKECRGAHTVYDYEHPADHPEFPLGRNDQEWMKHTLWYSEGNRLDYKPVNLKPLTVESIPPKVRTF